jgi:hypothetical protein
MVRTNAGFFSAAAKANEIAVIVVSSHSVKRSCLVKSETRSISLFRSATAAWVPKVG